MDKLSELVAKNEIEEVIFRYARGVDRRDWDAVSACFHPDAIDQHGEFTGTPPEFIEWVRKRHANVPFSMHFVGNCLIEFMDDRRAVVETYFIAMQRREVPSINAARSDNTVPTTRCSAGTATCWKGVKMYGGSHARKVVYDSTRTQPSSNHLRQLAGVIGKRDGSDAVFGMAAEAAE